MKKYKKEKIDKQYMKIIKKYKLQERIDNYLNAQYKDLEEQINQLLKGE